MAALIFATPAFQQVSLQLSFNANDMHLTNFLNYSEASAPNGRSWNDYVPNDMSS